MSSIPTRHGRLSEFSVVTGPMRGSARFPARLANPWVELR